MRSSNNVEHCGR